MDPAIGYIGGCSARRAWKRRGRLSPRREPLDILVVDDESGQREILAEILTDAGHRTRTAPSGAQALELLSDRRADLLLTDLRMPRMDGVALLAAARERHPSLTVILMTAYASVESAVAAMKKGAHDYLQKPFTKEELLQRVGRVAERVALIQENARLARELSEHAAPDILGGSAAIDRLKRQLDRLAAAPGDVLVTGESGTGKELAARHLHYQSARAGGPFVAVNCAAIPESLAESELFGHTRGAFTDASSARSGRFEDADGGTLFLDEIGSMPPTLQAKLLRVLEDRVVQRVGSSKPVTLDVRVVSATNDDLRTSIAAGRFREDLYHRLNVLEVRVPPLRDREGDVRLLAEVFRDRAALRYGVPAPEITAELFSFLERYPFPGNVRELAHLMEKLVVLSDGDPLTVEDLPPSIDREGVDRAPAFGPTDRDTAGGDADGAAPETLLTDGSVSLYEVERRLLREAIRLSDGNLSEAAKRLGISYKTMRYRARKFGLDAS